MTTKKENEKADSNVLSTPKIYGAMANINSKVGAITKSRENKEQRYKFRGIDDVYNELHQYFAEERVIILPRFIESRREERQTRNGGVLIYTISSYEFTFVADDGSSVSITLQGEGMDSGDKSINKSFSGALKYALMSAFLIPTNDPKDSENESPAPAPEPVANVRAQAIEMKRENAPKVEENKPLLPEARFNKFITQLQTDGDPSGLIKTVKDRFTLTEKQLNVIADWEAVLTK